MADYFEQTVVQQSIPETDMTPLERLLLSRIFQSERDREAWYFFAEDNPCTMIHATRAELVEALASSPDRDSAAHRYVTERLAAVRAQAEEIDLDLSVTSWEDFLQDVVKRSRTLVYISVVHLQQDAAGRVRRHSCTDYRGCHSREIDQRLHRGIPVGCWTRR